MTIPFGIVTIQDHFVVCLCDAVVAAASATGDDLTDLPALAAAFADTVRTSVREVAAVELGSPVLVDLGIVVESLIDDGVVTDGARARQSLVDRYTDAPEIVATYLAGGHLAVEQLVAAWLSECG